MPKFAKTAATIAVEDRLIQGSDGNTISVREMEAICGEPCDGSRTTGWQTVARLIPRVERTHGIVWRWQRRDMHWLCLGNSERACDVFDRQQRIRSQVRRSRVVLDTVLLNELPKEEQLKVVCHANVIGALDILTRPRNIKRLIAAGAEKILAIDEEALLKLCRTRIKENGN